MQYISAHSQQQLSKAVHIQARASPAMRDIDGLAGRTLNSLHLQHFTSFHASAPVVYALGATQNASFVCLPNFLARPSEARCHHEGS